MRDSSHGFRPGDRVTRYFRQRYPERESTLARFGFRGDHRQTLEVLAELDLPLAGAQLLDYGCGDGLLLTEMLAREGLSGADRPAVQLEDIVPADLARAVTAVGPWAASVGFTNVADIERWPTTQHDVVLAIGVLDYAADWREMLRLLTERTRHILVLTLPLRRPLRNLPRRAWLALHGVQTHVVSPGEVQTIGRELDVEVSVMIRGRTMYACLSRRAESV